MLRRARVLRRIPRRRLLPVRGRPKCRTRLRRLRNRPAHRPPDHLPVTRPERMRRSLQPGRLRTNRRIKAPSRRRLQAGRLRGKLLRFQPLRFRQCRARSQQVKHHPVRHHPAKHHPAKQRQVKPPQLQRRPVRNRRITIDPRCAGASPRRQRRKRMT
jgi:hypothetical protein